MTNKNAILFWMPQWGGFHLAGWREDGAPHDPNMNLAAIRRMVQTAERGRFHACFLADSLVAGLEGARVSNRALSRTVKGSVYEPITLMSALSGCTDRIGLLCTSSTTYNEPYHVARMFASLDHLSGGRAGWNVVTGSGPAESVNFGQEQHMDHSARYARSQEFFDIVTALWDSWEDDAFVYDRTSGIFFDPGKLHAVNYRGEYLSAAGPLNIARPVQGHPVIAQAGSSPPGRAFAARNADVVYTLQADLGKAQTFYAELKEQVAENGRAPEDVKVLPALLLIVGRSQAEADDKLARLDALVDPELGLERLNSMLEADLSDAPLDGPVPEVAETQSGAKTRQKYFVDLAKRDNLTVRQLMQVTARVGSVACTPTSIADLMQEWLESGAADGFNVTFGDATDSLDVFVDNVIPELQRRGLFHTDYRGATLRESLGIPRPLNQFSAPIEQVIDEG